MVLNWFIFSFINICNIESSLRKCHHMQLLLAIVCNETVWRIGRSRKFTWSAVRQNCVSFSHRRRKMYECKDCVCFIFIRMVIPYCVHICMYFIFQNHLLYNFVNCKVFIYSINEVISQQFSSNYFFFHLLNAQTLLNAFLYLKQWRLY